VYTHILKHTGFRYTLSSNQYYLIPISRVVINRQLVFFSDCADGYGCRSRYRIFQWVQGERWMHEVEALYALTGGCGEGHSLFPINNHLTKMFLPHQRRGQSHTSTTVNYICIQIFTLNVSNFRVRHWPYLILGRTGGTAPPWLQPCIRECMIDSVSYTK